MKRNTFIIWIALLCLLLGGCGRSKNPYQVDTVIRIPVNPTSAPTDAAQTEPAAIPEETEAAETEAAATEAPTEASEPEATAGPTEGKSGSGGKKPTSTPKPGNPKQDNTGSEKTTEPPATEAETQPPTEYPFDPSDYSLGSLEYEILDALNGYRAEAGLGELSVSTRLSGIAALRADECSEVWSHTRPDGRGYTTALTDYGYSFGTAAQCLGHVGSAGGAADVVAKWMTTDSKNAILDENFTTVGIGIFRSGGVTIAAVLLTG